MIDENENNDSLELDHLLGPFKRINPDQLQKANWKYALEMVNNKKIKNRWRHQNPWAIALFSNLILAFTILLWLPINQSKMIGHAIAIQFTDMTDKETYRQLSTLPAIKSAKLLKHKSLMQTLPRELILIENDIDVNIDVVAEKIVSIKGIEKLKITPIIKKVEKRLYKNIAELFATKKNSNQECYDFFLKEKKIPLEESEFLPTSQIVDLSQSILNTKPFVDKSSTPVRSFNKPLIRKVTVKK